jgi:hypothetical protein
LAQFAMRAQPDLGLAKGRAFLTHQTENGQQLGFVEQALAETTSVAREHRPATCRATRADDRSPTSAIAPPASIANNIFKGSSTSNFLCRNEHVNRAT